MIDSRRRLSRPSNFESVCANNRTNEKTFWPGDLFCADTALRMAVRFFRTLHKIGHFAQQRLLHNIIDRMGSSGGGPCGLCPHPLRCSLRVRTYSIFQPQWRHLCHAADRLINRHRIALRQRL